MIVSEAPIFCLLYHFGKYGTLQRVRNVFGEHMDVRRRKDAGKYTGV